MLVHAIPTNVSYEFAADVRAGLTRTGQKELPSKYFMTTWVRRCLK